MKTWAEWLKTKDKKLFVYIFLLLALGVLLMLFGGRPWGGRSDGGSLIGPLPLLGEEPTAAPASQTDVYASDVKELEKKLEELFSLVDGAGKVRVMVSPLPGKETQYAVDANTTESYSREQDAEGGSRETRQRTSQESTVIIRDSSGQDRALVLREIEPKIAGVAIIAEGGDNIFVKDALTKAACAILGLEANKVQVLKMKGE